MKKRIASICLFLFFIFVINVYSSEIVTEPVSGAGFKKVINLYEPRGGADIVGTLEVTSADAGGRVDFCIRDVNGIEIYASYLSGIFGGIEVLYNEADEYITGFRYFGARTLDRVNATTQFWVIYSDAKLNWSTNYIFKWPTDTSETNQRMYSPSGMVTFDDGSYTVVGLDQNSDKICITYFDSEDTMIGSEIKYLDMTEQSGGFVGSISQVKVAKLSDDQIIIGATVRSDQMYDLFLANIDTNGDHNLPPLA
ncbi:MAG: hypothetical protein U9M94_04340, partial [Patescibacteria group bacterium]|nr:hypothetical protein [Patescibacteria group bacterium]